MEKKPTIGKEAINITQNSVKIYSNPLETLLRKEPAELKTDHESGTVPQSKIPNSISFHKST